MTECERIVGECADTVCDIAAEYQMFLNVDDRRDHEPFDDKQYEKIKLAIKDAIQAAVESLTGEMEAWAE